MISGQKKRRSGTRSVDPSGGSWEALNPKMPKWISGSRELRARCRSQARRQDIEDSARPRHRGQSEALDWRTLCACLGMLAPWFRSVNVLRLVLFWSANRSPNSVAVFTSLGPRVTNGCIASAIRGAMVCGIVPVGHAAHHGNWHHAGGWRCANSAAVIRPGGRVNCAPVCATYTPAFTCQRHAPSPAGCAG